LSSLIVIVEATLPTPAAAHPCRPLRKSTTKLSTWRRTAYIIN